MLSLKILVLRSNRPCPKQFDIDQVDLVVPIKKVSEDYVSQS